MTSLDREYKYFENHRDELLKQYLGKYIVIKEEEIIGSYASDAQAYAETIKSHKLGTFLIQLCLPEKELPPQVFHSRVIF